MKHRVTKAVVLAAGKGTRMLSLCRHQPKPMLPLANRPFLLHILDNLRAGGIEETLLVVGHRSEQIRSFFSGGSAHEMRVEFVDQQDPNGTGSAALLAKTFAADEPFALVFGDIMTSRENYVKLTRHYATHRPDALLTTRYVDDPYRGAAVYVENRRVARIEEKPPKGTATTHWDNAGLFVLPPSVFELLERLDPSPRGEYELTDALHAIVERGLCLEACEMEGFWENVTGPRELIRTNRLIMAEAKDRQEILISPRAEVSDGAAVSPWAAVAENVRVGACRLGDNVSVAAGASVEDGAHLENVIVLPRATIGRGARLAWCVVNEGARVGDDAAIEAQPDAAQVVD